MGEEAKQQGETKATEAPKQEEKAAAEQKEEKKEEVKPSPPPPIVLFIDLHCFGCSKKIERSILKCRGVEEVETNLEKNEVTVKGKVDPQALCALIQKKTSRKAKVLSPLPPPDAADSTITQPPPPQEQDCGGIATVELLVNMHCEACAQQLRKKIMKMGGVQAAETDRNAQKVTVTGTIKAAKLVDYIHRRTGKIATIIPPPPPAPPAPEEKKDNGETKGENTEKLSEEKKENNEKKSMSEDALKAMNGDEEMLKRMMYWNGGGGYSMMNVYDEDDETSKRMMMMRHWMPVQMATMAMPTAMAVFDRPPQLLLPPPPPQMFSDENPNACCIS